MRLGIAFAFGLASSGCGLFYPLDDYGTLERDTGPAAVRLVQSKDENGAGVRSTSVTLQFPLGSGNLLVVVAASTESLPTSVMYGDTPLTRVTGTQAHIPLSVWTMVAPAGAPTSSVTVTWPTDPTPQTTTLVFASEWSGLAGLDEKSTNSGTAGGEITTGSIVTTTGTGLLLAAGAGHLEMADAGTSPLGAPTSSIAFTALPTLSHNDTQLALAYATSPPAGTTTTVSWSYDLPLSWEADFVSFKHP